jgi:cytochrome c
MRLEGRSRRMLSAVLAAAVVLASLATTAGCASPGGPPAGTSTVGSSAPATTAASSDASSPAPQPTRADVQAFVDKAVEYARTNGKDAALRTFTSPGGEFHRGELYIYAYDFNGTVIAHGGDKTLVGKDLIGMKDTNGVMVISELVRLAKTGSGWLMYTWPNPAHGNKQEPKLGYVVKVDDTWFLGSGTYGPAAAQP